MKYESSGRQMKTQECGKIGLLIRGSQVQVLIGELKIEAL